MAIDFNQPIRVSVVNLVKRCPTHLMCMWLGLDSPLSVSEIRRARPNRPGTGCLTRAENAGRIRWFVDNGWSDPIEIDVGIPGERDVDWPVRDGNHRLAAAILLRHESILAKCDGEASILEELVVEKSVLPSHKKFFYYAISPGWLFSTSTRNTMYQLCRRLLCMKN